MLQFAAESCCDIKAEGGAAERGMTAVCPYTLLYSISSAAVCAFNLFHPLSHAAWTERRKHKCHINKNRRLISTQGKHGARGGRKKNDNLVWKIVWLHCYLRFVFARRLSVGLVREITLHLPAGDKLGLKQVFAVKDWFSVEIIA